MGELRTSPGRALEYRPAALVMDLNRLGCSYPYPLSFMRCLVRRILKEKWDIKRGTVALCEEGYGHIIYDIKTPNGRFSYAAFAKRLPPNLRNDRVIADDWNVTVALVEGEIDEARLADLKANVPLQEKGRFDARTIVLSRGNQSVRNFDYVVERLSSGLQPDVDHMAKVGYLYRTTAVYGSGKFGMADWNKVRETYPDFARPFCAEMFSCFLLRDFSLFQAEHAARSRAPETAVPMDEAIKRYIGIGNSTGLGMAPYLINHPLLINNWIDVRETALARVKQAPVNEKSRGDFDCLAQKSDLHLCQISTDNVEQNALNARACEDLRSVMEWFKNHPNISDWSEVTHYCETHFGHEVQELVNSILLETHPELFLDLEDRLNVDEHYAFVPQMKVFELRQLIETHYGWALDVDFTREDMRATFWYRSEEKAEPRLGRRFEEPGAEKEMMLGIAYAAQAAYGDLGEAHEDSSTARFVMKHPQHRAIIRRMQTMAQTRLGEIRANVLRADILPIHLLRCKLSFFGVGKFDPLSRLWVRNTMFQGAPLVSDIGQTEADVWCFPIKPRAQNSRDD